MNSHALAAPAVRLLGSALLATLFAPAFAADILEASYNAARDEIEVEIAYRGTNPDHEFTVQWGECSRESPPRTVGRLIDRQGRDAAREDYRASARISLEEIPCRPAIVTLRLGRTAHTNVFVPRHIQLLGGRPDRPYDEIGRIEARGSPGEQRSFVYQELRNKARALGADAVIEFEERTRMDRLPATDAGEAPRLGNAYPGVLRKTEPGAFPPAGFDVQAGGRYYEAEGIAIRYRDEAS